MSDPLLVFYDNYLPSLQAGRYTLTVEQSVTAPGATVPSSEQPFEVVAPQFTLDPGELHATFPPQGASGQFAGILPNVVLNKRALPWERDIPGVDRSVPWMALLLFAPGELAGDANGGRYAQSLTVAQLLAPVPGVRKPSLDPAQLSSELLQSTCQSILVPSALFTSVVPNAAELTRLAHCREVESGDKASLDQLDPDELDPGWFSVVVGNRFPLPGASNVAHLVSLEGFGAILDGRTAIAEAVVQVVSLASFNFVCQPDGTVTFSGLARNLAALDTASLLLRLPIAPPASSDPGATRAAKQRLFDGYVPLGYHTPAGEDSFAWYRGPLAPTAQATLRKTGPFAASSAAMIYDQTAGVFDHSLAAAWQAGRSLALADQTFAEALFQLQKDAFSVVDQAQAAAQLPQPGTAMQNLVSLLQAGALDAIGNASRSGAPPPRLGREARPPQPPIAALRSFFGATDVQALLAAEPRIQAELQALVPWLAELRLLARLPFVHLVADPRMLPVESIRFFYVDGNWLDALVDGALSIGIGFSGDAAVQPALRNLIQLALDALQPAPVAGFLIRSGLVSGWPGLSVRSYAAGASDPLTPLRLVRLAPNVMIGLLPSVPAQLLISEPHEGLAFGVDDQGAMELRRPAPPGAGQPLARTLFVFNPDSPDGTSASGTTPLVRAGGKRVLNLDAGGSDLLAALAAALSLPGGRDALGPAALALQMIRAPEQLTFTPFGGQAQGAS